MTDSCAACNEPLPAGAVTCPACGEAVFDAEAALATRPGTAIPPVAQAQVDSGTIDVGTVIDGRYRILHRLGSGNMGSVYRAQDLSLGEDIALKFLALECAIDADCAALLTNEVKLSRQVTHPNVCRVHDFGEFEGRSYITMEYVDGEDLKTLLRRIGHVHGEKAHHIARQICSGLQAAHERRVLHRDLKPANVMLDSEGNVRIADFGIAAAVGTDTESVRGTPAYMAPELFTGGPPTVQSDLYSLGLVLYELYTGHQLYRADSMTELLDLHRTTRPSLRERVHDIDPDVEAIILALLARDPADRPDSVAAVLASLPGGDPLAAALAAGRTPSPELVAEAGGTHTIARRTGIILVVSILLGWMCVGWMSEDIKLVGRAPLPSSGGVLAHLAAKKIDALFGHSAADKAAGATAWRFEVNEGYLRAIEAEDTRPDRWTRRLALTRPALIDFWYRFNPTVVQPDNIKGRVRWDDPPFASPGMIRLRLDPTGRLQELEAIPRAVRTFRDEAAIGDPTELWRRLFAAAGLTFEKFHAVAPQLVPATAATTRAAWTGSYPESGMAIRVEAALFGAEPVRFLIDEERGLGDTARTAPHARYRSRTPTWRLGGLILLLAAAVIMAIRAVRRGESDFHGAVCLGSVAFGLVIVFTLLTGDHHGRLLGFGHLFLSGMSHGMLVGGQLVLFYLALEPHVRRTWPETVISWSRLLSGRFHDPLIGFHLLTGVAIGLGATLFQLEQHVVARWAGESAGPPVTFSFEAMEALRGPIAGAGALCELVVDLGQESMKCLLALVLLKLIVRSRTAAAILLVVVFTFVWNQRSYGTTLWQVVGFTGTAVMMAAFTFALVRYGIIAMMAAVIVYGTLLNFPLTLNPDNWYSGGTLLSFLLIGAACFHGYRTATR